MNWTELNSATWKSTKSVHLVLLNDHLLVAAKKRGKTSNEPRRAVADRCWNLADIEVNEITGDRAGTRGALQVTRGREVAVYSAGEGRDSERTSFMQAIKRAAIDLHNRSRQGESPYRGNHS
jgi:exocyst complex component 8